MKKNVLDVICQTHTEGKEKALFAREFLEKVGEADVSLKIDEMLEFFYSHIPVHFLLEEMMMSELMKAPGLTKDDKLLMGRIADEHELIKKNFERIKEMAEKIKKGNTSLKEPLINLVQETLEALLDHAEVEDNLLFPLANSKLEDKQLEIIKGNIDGIVK